MADNPLFPNKIRYEYETPDDVKPTYAHGVWGGVNPHGEIEMNFYMESDKMPRFGERVFHPDGALGEEATDQDGATKYFVRRVGARVLLNYHAAKAVIDWLQEKVDAFESDAAQAQFLFDENGPEQ